MDNSFNPARIRIIVKILLILLCLFIIKIFVKVGKDNIIIPPEGDYVRLQDVLILSRALQDDIIDTEIYRILEQLHREGEKNLSYQEYTALLEQLGTETTPLFDGKYKKESHLLKEDWYQAFEDMRVYFDTAGEIQTVEISVLGIGSSVKDSQGVMLEERSLLAENGTAYIFASDEFLGQQYWTLTALCKGNELLTLKSIKENDLTLKNVWIMEAGDSGLNYFQNDYEVQVAWPQNQEMDSGAVREQLADLFFNSGTLVKIAVKPDKISGKIIAIDSDQITVEGYGALQLDSDVKVYRLYEALKACTIRDLAVGYGFTDFVMENGKICGALIARRESMEYIRVAIKTNEFAGLTHETVAVTADTDYELTFGEFDNRQTIQCKSGEIIELQPDSEFMAGERVTITPKTQTGRLTLLSLKRSQGVPMYRGMLEISKGDGGLIVINEVLMEEYLYSVVPSEMPASYPMEALKAQAICARTYAYRYLLHSALAGIGAHVDDSVSYQVYNNIAENAETTKAVKETTGKMLYYQGAPAGTYYYSTSCGYGTTADVWKSEGREDISYLHAGAIGGQEAVSPEEMTNEEVFAEFIANPQDSDYEKDEAWYRWSYTIEQINLDKITDNLKSKYNSNPKLVLTLKDGEYVSLPVKQIGEIKDIYCEKRLLGGVMDELVIETTKNTYKVISENAIRFTLSDGKTKVCRQDGSETVVTGLLPSAFMTISTDRKDDRVTGYTLIGGGYGHGVGMSQNGAKAMGARGFNTEEILNCFYSECSVETIY